MLTVWASPPGVRSIFLDALFRPPTQPWVLIGPVANRNAAGRPDPEPEAKAKAKEPECLRTGRV